MASAPRSVKADAARRWSSSATARADALKPFWKGLRPRGARIQTVAMDMSAAYRSAVAIHLPKAYPSGGPFNYPQVAHILSGDWGARFTPC